MKHDPTICTRIPGAANTLYCGKSWKAQFKCPACGRKCWQNLNYLGRRDLVCDGNKFAKHDRELFEGIDYPSQTF